MFNLQGSEIIVILLIALVVLGPEKLPEAVRKFTQTYSELKKMSTGFQSELKSALDEPMREMRETADLVRNAADPRKIMSEAEAEQRVLDDADAAAARTVEPSAANDWAAPVPGPPTRAATATDRARRWPTRLRPGRHTGLTTRELVLMTVDDDEELSGADTMTLTEHLAELRVRIIRSALAVAIGMVLIIAFYDQVLEFLLQPYVELCERKSEDFCDPELFNFSPTEGLATRVRVGLYGGIVVALPVLLWQAWRFIVPALNQKEKKWAIPIVLVSLGLFVAGGALAYFTVGQALEFLIGWSGSNVNQVYSVQSYVSLIGLMIFAFGLGFMLPVFVFGAQAFGVVTPRRLLSSWRLALVVIAVISAVITPSGDPVTMAMLGVPMMVLYFLAILIGWLVVRRRPVDA